MGADANTTIRTNRPKKAPARKSVTLEIPPSLERMLDREAGLLGMDVTRLMMRKLAAPLWDAQCQPLGGPASFFRVKPKKGLDPDDPGYLVCLLSTPAKGLFAATVREFPDLTSYGPTARVARSLICNAIQTTARALVNLGRPLPKPIQ